MSLLLALAAAGSAIFIAGDSTAAPYGDDRYPQSGWGQMLPCALDGVRVENRAMGGRSTRTFVSEGRWARLLGDLVAGDTVLIQFGHNDANRERPERYAGPSTDYRWHLVRFVRDVRARGAVPVILTPVARRSFDEAGAARADFADYSSVARRVAGETGAALIDLERLSRDWLDAAGPEASKAYYLHYRAEEGVAAFPNGIADDTHFSELGARHVAGLVAGALARLDLPVSAAVKPERASLTTGRPRGDRSCGG